MADAKDILGLPKAPLGASTEKRSRAPKETPKKPDGVSREVYALTGGLPPVMPTLDTASLKKRQPASSKKISWQWLPFTNSARTDNFQLYHWVKVVDSVPPTGDYFFAKYNKTVDVVRYSDEEYAKYLTNPNWSRQETDQLFELCEQFDLRFIIIADRFHPPRTVEELKSRYYSAAKAIILARAAVPEDVADHTLVKDSYNMANEVERKRALGMLLSQSRQQEREDAEVLAEAKRISEARLNAKGGEEPEASLTGTGGAAANGDVVEKAPSTPARPGSPSPVHPPRPSATAAIPASNAANVATSSGPRLPRVYLRASLLAQMVHATVPAGGARIAKRIDQTLEELGVRIKPKVPTQAVCAEHLELRKEVLHMLNLQKQVQLKQMEVSVLRDNPYADIPPTPSTPKKSHRGGDPDRVSTRATNIGDSEGFPGERLGKREHKRKAPARFSEAPPSPPHNKRARKMKASEG